MVSSTRRDSSMRCGAGSADMVSVTAPMTPCPLVMGAVISMPSTWVSVSTSPDARAFRHDGASRRSRVAASSTKPEWCMRRSVELPSSASAIATASQAIA
jgi:hypothetical protein